MVASTVLLLLTIFYVNQEFEISKLNLPRAFVEYRIRLYLKKKDKGEREEYKKYVLLHNCVAKSVLSCGRLQGSIQGGRES